MIAVLITLVCFLGAAYGCAQRILSNQPGDALAYLFTVVWCGLCFAGTVAVQ